jgi:hypothetical protein
VCESFGPVTIDRAGRSVGASQISKPNTYAS